MREMEIPGHAERPAASGTTTDLAVGLKLAACCALSIAALAARGPVAVGIVTVCSAALVAYHRMPVRIIVKGLKLYVWQSAVITALYVIRFGPGAGVLPALTVSWQLYMAFLPGAVFINSTPQHRITSALGRALPQRTAFVISTSMKFVPHLVSAILSIYEVQLMRGARIKPRDLFSIAGWRDAVHCLLVPSVVKALALADDVALAARARDFGASTKRTCWPGE